MCIITCNYDNTILEYVIEDKRCCCCSRGRGEQAALLGLCGWGKNSFASAEKERHCCFWEGTIAFSWDIWSHRGYIKGSRKHDTGLSWNTRLKKGLIVKREGLIIFAEIAFIPSYNQRIVLHDCSEHWRFKANPMWLVIVALVLAKAIQKLFFFFCLLVCVSNAWSRQILHTCPLSFIT